MDSLVKAIDGLQAEAEIHYWRSDKWLRRPIRYVQAKKSWSVAELSQDFADLTDVARRVERAGAPLPNPPTQHWCRMLLVGRKA